MSNNKKVLVLGSSGMLGNQIYNDLLESSFDVYGTNRSNIENQDLDRVFTFEHTEEKLISKIEEIKPNIIINCIAKLKEGNYDDKLEMIYSNCTLPIFVCNYCIEKNIYFIHFSTDAVFKSSVNYHKVDDCYSPESFYGMSKAISESIKNNSLVLRVCPIGYENHSNRSLFNFIYNSKEDKINGFKNCYFNGTTTNVISERVINIINSNEKIYGIHHITGPKISKYELLEVINRECELNKTIIPVDKPEVCRLLDNGKFSTNDPWYFMIKKLKK